MKYILIIVFLGWGQRGNTELEVVKIEFGSEFKCSEARKSFDLMRQDVRKKGGFNTAFDMKVSNCVFAKSKD